jgi:hypothetical protein
VVLSFFFFFFVLKWRIGYEVAQLRRNVFAHSLLFLLFLFLVALAGVVPMYVEFEIVCDVCSACVDLRVGPMFSVYPLAMGLWW